MKKLLLISLLLLSFSFFSKAQTPTSSGPITYKMKLSGVNTAAAAKDASLELRQLFDSDDQTFSPADSMITVKSAFDETEEKFKEKLISHGYPSFYFRKIINASTTVGAEK